MKKFFPLLFIGVFVLIFVFPGTNTNANTDTDKNTRADIISISGSMMILNKGEKDGVKIGMTGIVKTMVNVSGIEYDINVGEFVIQKVMTDTSRAYITRIGSAKDLGQARFVVFNETLIPPTPTESETFPKSIDWYIEEGEKEFEKGNYETAKKHFQEALKLDPKNPVARNFLDECQKIIQRQIWLENKRKSDNYILKGDKNIDSKRIKIGISYYLNAYTIFPGNGTKISEKLFHLWLKDKSIGSYLLEDGGDTGKKLLGYIYLEQAEIDFDRDNLDSSKDYLEKARKFLDGKKGKRLEKKIMSALRKRKGILKISAYPFADVYIDHRFLGEVPPVTIIELHSGKHKVKLVKSKKEVYENTILIEYSRATTVHCNFETRIVRIGNSKTLIVNF